jgi:hypothetical protein
MFLKIRGGGDTLNPFKTYRIRKVEEDKEIYLNDTYIATSDVIYAHTNELEGKRLIQFFNQLVEDIKQENIIRIILSHESVSGSDVADYNNFYIDKELLDGNYPDNIDDYFLNLGDQISITVSKTKCKISVY